MADRSYCDSKLDESVCELCPQESHHLAHVLRKRVGDEVVLFNGRGREATGEIQTVQRGSVSVRIRNRRDFPPDRSSLVTLATAVPKGERFRWLVEKACELGVDRLVPLRTERSIVHPSEGKMGKMKQTVIAAAKQSGAVFLMQVDEVTPWADLLEPGESARTLLVAHPGGESPARALEQVQPGDSILLAIGPEGGWTDDEMSQAVVAGGRPVGLGSGILRIETAAITLAGFCRLHFLGKS